MMKQLGGLDAMFLHAENNNFPMHISSFSVYNPDTAPCDTVGFHDIVDLYRRKIETQLPILRSKLVTVPMNLDQPYWVEDPHFNIDLHTYHKTLTRNGSWDQLRELLADLHAQPLDRSHALWEVHVIDGIDSAMDVPKGCFGLFFKVHHAIMDGRTGMAIFTALHSLEPDQETMQCMR